MNVESIKNHKAWKYISSLTPVQRHQALLGSSRAMLQQEFGCKIEEWPYTMLPSVDDNMIATAVTDPYRNIGFLAVLIPITE